MSTKYPPALSLAEAVRVIKEMYDLHKSREVSIDLMPDIFKVKQGSSYFPSKIAALQKFGFADKKPNDQLQLTDQAMMIINPIESGETHGAKYLAFNKVDVLKDLIGRYPNYQLPSPEQLKQYLMKSHGVEREKVHLWFDFVVESFRELASTSPKIGGDPLPQMQPAKTPAEFSRQTQSQAFRIPMPSGTVFEYSMGSEYTVADMEFLRTYFDLIKTSAKD